MTAEHTSDPAAPDTIVLMHGLWVTPRSWVCKEDAPSLKDHREGIGIVVMWVHNAWGGHLCVAIRGKVED
jgi:hypothetical protein